MKKVYQVFISSTYKDLEKERVTVLNALLSINCLPAGMEYFPAASEEQFEYIKRIIDRSDYYVLIIAGRYGSIDENDENGRSYTEKEYDYAVKKGIPVLAFVRNHIEDIPARNVDMDADKREKLEQFKKKVMNGKLCSFWTHEYELATKVISSLEKAIEIHPRPGMVRMEEIDPGYCRCWKRIRRIRKSCWQISRVKWSQAGRYWMH